MREISIEIYIDIPVKFGSPNFFKINLNPLILELKLSSSIQNSNRQQLKNVFSFGEKKTKVCFCLNRKWYDCKFFIRRFLSC